MTRRLRAATVLVSDIGSLAFDLQHHDPVDIAKAVAFLREVNGPMFDWLVRVLEPRQAAPAVVTQGSDPGGDACPRASRSDALSALPAQERTQGAWQPIDTAPKNGTTVIGFDASREYEPEEGLGAIEFMRWIDGAWLDPCTHSMRPTHWMPLPAAPGQPSPAQKG